MSIDPTRLDAGGPDEASVESYLTPTVDFPLIVAVTIPMSAAAVALMIP